MCELNKYGLVTVWNSAQFKRNGMSGVNNKLAVIYTEIRQIQVPIIFLGRGSKFYLNSWVKGGQGTNQ